MLFELISREILEEQLKTRNLRTVAAPVRTYDDGTPGPAPLPQVALVPVTRLENPR